MNAATLSEPLLTCKELASELRCHVSYVYAMRCKGFMMPGNKATVTEARAWLIRNPAPKSRKL